ncbi:MAG: hypothetical protein M3R27_06085 [Bacteroidota bacterium]|nr:hypothetical protein [Bacteroidota bacterium]
MKLIPYLIAGLSIVTAFAANAISGESITKVSATHQEDQSRLQIKPEELPEAVKKTLAEDKYKGWEISAVYWVKSKMEYYEVLMVKETASKTFKFDKEGKAVEEVKKG